MRPSIDRSANGGHGGSIVLVLLVAAFLVASATAMAFLGTRQCRALYSRVPRRTRHRRGVFAVRSGRGLVAGLRRAGRKSAGQDDRRRGRRRHRRHRSRRPHRLCQCRLSRSHRRHRRQRHAPGRARLHRRRRRLGGDLPAAQGRARGQAARGRSADRRPARPAGALAAIQDPSAWRQPARRAIDGLGARRRDGRARPPGERVPGAAALDRLSRSRAGRLLLGRRQGRCRLSQRDARQLARPGSGAGRLGRPEAHRSRRRRRRGADHDAARRAGRG